MCLCISVWFQAFWTVQGASSKSNLMHITFLHLLLLVCRAAGPLGSILRQFCAIVCSSLLVASATTKSGVSPELADVEPHFPPLQEEYIKKSSPLLLLLLVLLLLLLQREVFRLVAMLAAVINATTRRWRRPRPPTNCLYFARTNCFYSCRVETIGLTQCFGAFKVLRTQNFELEYSVHTHTHWHAHTRYFV
jgi:hypothetical protein